MMGPSISSKTARDHRDLVEDPKMFKMTTKQDFSSFSRILALCSIGLEPQRGEDSDFIQACHAFDGATSLGRQLEASDGYHLIHPRNGYPEREVSFGWMGLESFPLTVSTKFPHPQRAQQPSRSETDRSFVYLTLYLEDDRAQKKRPFPLLLLFCGVFNADFVLTQAGPNFFEPTQRAERQLTDRILIYLGFLASDVVHFNVGRCRLN